MFNSLSNDKREWKTSTNKSSAFATTLPCQLYTPGAWVNLSNNLVPVSEAKLYSQMKYNFSIQSYI